MVADFYEQLETEIKNKFKEKTDEEKEAFYNRRKVFNSKLQLDKLPLSGGKIISSNIGTSALGMYGHLNSGNSSMQFTYDLKEPTYCYCGRSSFGEMVLC